MKVPAITVDLNEPARQRWIRPGRKIARLVNQLTDSLLATLREGLPRYLQPLLTKKNALTSWLGYLPARVLCSQLLEEAEGLSRATGVSAPLLALANCAYDAAQLADDSEPSACSAAVYQGKCGYPVMIRYMDWAFPEDIGRYTVQVDYVRDGVPVYSSLGFAGFLGVITAMAPGWALAFNQAPAANVKMTILGSPATYASRQACDRSETFSEIACEISSANAFTPFLSLICGTNPGEMLRIERPEKGRATKAKPTKGCALALSNHYLHRAHRKFNSGADNNGDTDERLAEVEQIAHSLQRSVKLPTFTRLKTPPVYNSATVHTAVMCPGAETFKFSTRTPR